MKIPNGSNEKNVLLYNNLETHSLWRFYRTSEFSTENTIIYFLKFNETPTRDTVVLHPRDYSNCFVAQAASSPRLVASRRLSLGLIRASTE